ncbi:MAG: hypothetical protein HY830_17775 [Actinobacteria bacterium]|nr:hypothetical protein [Actinomycetota bacterium]
MNLIPVRRGPQPLRMVRELVRPGTLAWFGVGVAATGLLTWWGTPGAGLVGPLVGGAAGARTLATAARSDRERYARGELGLRAPRAADPGAAPLPSSADLARRFRRSRFAVRASTPLALVALAATPVLARDPSTGPFGLPNEVWWAVGPVFALWWAWLVRSELKRLAPLRGNAVEALPRGVVTVLGFSNDVGEGVRFVVADGAVAVPRDPTTGAYDEVWAGCVARRAWRDVVPGDVLVRDGHLVGGEVVALSDGTESGWVTHLERVPRSEFGGPRTWREDLEQLEARGRDA